MLKPHPKDPNYKAEMKRFEKDPKAFSGTAAERDLGAPTPAAQAAAARGYKIEGIRRRLCAHYGIDPIATSVGDKTKPIAEALYAEAKEDETRVNYDAPLVEPMLHSAGLL